jgi:16S rRNA processing protein RimM
LLGLPSVLLEGASVSRETRVSSARRAGGAVIVAFEHCRDPSAAEALRGLTVLVDRAALPAAEPDEYYDTDLIGLEARDAGGSVLGHVVGVEHPPSSDVLVVRLQSGDHVDVPMIAAFVPAVEPPAGFVILDLPEGLPTRRRP